MNKFFSQKQFISIAIIFVIAIFFLIDRYLKFIAFTKYQTSSRPLLGDWISFSFAKNYFISFSLPLPVNLIIAFSLLALAVIILIIVSLIKKNKRLVSVIAWLMLIFMGAISNLIDRFSFGYVIDYLKIFKFSILNLADIMISLGTILTIIYFYRHSSTNTNTNEKRVE